MSASTDAPSLLNSLSSSCSGSFSGSCSGSCSGSWKILVAFVILLLCLFTTALGQTGNSTAPDGSIVLNTWANRWRQKLAAVKKGGVDLLFMGDSITYLWDVPANRSTFDAYFGKWHPLNIGISGARTETLIWMMQHGILDGIHPKLVVLLIGTNNTDGVHFPVGDDPWTTAAGIRAVVMNIRERLPDTKILLLNIFNRGNIPGAEKVVTTANRLLEGFADNRHIFQLDENSLWLNHDGHIDPGLMPDLLHPNPKGYLKWARALQPVIARFLGKMPNTAVIPQPGVEHDIYNWPERHAAELQYVKTHKPKIVFVGDSITHYWGGKPKGPLARGENVWNWYYGDRDAMNLGFGWDRTQQVLWRINHGELQGAKPKLAVVLIGTNNLAEGVDRANSNQEIVAGIKAVVADLHKHCPGTHVLLLGLLPRGQDPHDIWRLRIKEINATLAGIAPKWGASYVDCGPQFLDAKGEFIKGLTVDFLHPTEKGYAIIAKAIEPIVAKQLGDAPKSPWTLNLTPKS